MKFNTLATFFALTSGSLAAPAGEALEKRNPTGSFSLIAYGVASSYIKIFYSDGLAYAGDSSLWTYGSVTTDVTFTIGNTELPTTATTSGVTLDADTLFYIQPTADAITEVGFTGNGISTPSAATTESFLFYGTYLMWEESNGNLSDSFRLKETNVSGVYQMYWDQSNLYPSGYLLPTVKSLS
ncbi:hypothetical protein N7448_010643 [Penicillium atrosanguineum]|uniref:Uncharacterized protein n=1 Tax=Penicillium atrosanguineum TaxID=1132637 RepID=A0A9W9GGR6_9EURO|nr:uncharacterized protein N7443_007865 [Penicillium atrosanguineum]KAJ5118937.1 hypothetical protein N7526_010574 [Penicillium atrosanguineum]KAJ5119974.1 hypothetical protein N7448_010643 [Penicillium atrosanguineum]KAJ5296972.1 hypothetical protein N7443_007865 [Penicillium atrosanguineum]KAJ5299733.1 hypothetical protein N7476_011290 [Penicillium atrosanguineum]